MAIATEIERLQNAKGDLKNAINGKLKEGQSKIGSELISEYSSFVNNIQTGDGDVSDYFMTSDIALSGMNLGRYVIKKFPQLDLTGTTSLSYAFNTFANLEEVSFIYTSGVTDMSSCFRDCLSLKNIPLFDTSNVTSMAVAFSGCREIKSCPLLNTSKVTNMQSAFSTCTALETIPELDTGAVTTFMRTFYNCVFLVSLPKLDFKSANDISDMLATTSSSMKVTSLGGFENLGQAYLTTQSANYSKYMLGLQYCTGLTEQSIINVLTNLYDIATEGVQAQQVVLGADNLAKITSAEGQQALAQATTYGWTVS